MACTTTFVCNAGWTVLEALRRRASTRGIALTVDIPVQGYARPFGAIVGFAEPGSGSPTTIAIEGFESGDSAQIGTFLIDGWSAMARSLSRASTEYVVSAVAEIFENGITHARSDVGVLAAGQYYPKRDDLELSVVDLGIGIPGSLAAAFGRREEEIDAIRVLEWAFEPGRSSLRTSRGLGLAIVRGFVRRNGARLLIASGSAFAQADGEAWQTARLSTRFPGTLIVLTLPAQVRPLSSGEGLLP